MDKFTIIFIVVATLGIYVFIQIFKAGVKLLKKLSPAPDSSTNFIKDLDKNELSVELKQIVAQLEVKRLAIYNKTKGLFKRAFLKTWFVFTGGIILLTVGLGPEQADPVPAIVGPAMISLFIALIGAGIYTLIKKGSNNYTFSRLLKKELVSKIVTYVNPELAFFDKGITKEDFDKADLFNGSVFKSEDTIEGNIDGSKVVISECEQRSSATSSSREGTVTYFKGLFIQVELESINISKPLKIVPISNVNKNSISFSVGGSQKQLKTFQIYRLDDLEIPVPQESKNKSYKIFCDSEEEALSVLTPKFIKVIDYILNKYGNKDVLISLSKGMGYFAILWNDDMFETDVFLKNNLVESGIADKFHDDLVFINQIIKEIHLLKMT